MSDANSKDGQYRDQKLAALRLQALFEELAGFGLSVLGDILAIINGAESIFGRLQALVDLVATLATSIIPLVQEILGNGASWLFSVTSLFMLVGSQAQFFLSILNGENWWVKTGAELAAASLLEGVTGPAAIIQTGLSLLFEPVIGNLLDMGGHFLISKGLTDYSVYNDQETMSLQDWCTQDGGCPAES